MKSQTEPTYAMTTMGCQMNVHDSERMHEVLQRAGYREVDEPREADVIVLNTCSVREKAEQKLRSEVGRMHKLKRTRPNLTVVVAGCVAQQEGDRLLKTLRGIDVIVGPDHLASLPALIAEQEQGGLPRVSTGFDVDEPRFLTAASTTSGAVTSFVTTMKGCDERCSFCIVPYTRGPERYRPSADVVSEIAALVEGGVREITLLGQTVNSYRDPSRALSPAPEARPDDPDESEFAALLHEIARAVPNLRRLRYTSPHPRHLTPSLMRAHEDLSVLPRHVHMPVQSGSDRVLKRMIRRYRREEYVQRVADLRRRVPGLTVSTDIIVGFPGETEEDFAATLSLLEEVGFVGVFAFKYSVRPYAPARKLDDDVSEEEKADRLARLFDVSERLMSAHLERLVGSEQTVLIEGPSKSASGGAVGFTGRTERNEIVHINDDRAKHLVGEEVTISIVNAYKHSLGGELTEPSRARADERGLNAPAVTGRSRRWLPVLPSGVNGGPA